MLRKLLRRRGSNGSYEKLQKLLGHHRRLREVPRSYGYGTLRQLLGLYGKLREVAGSHGIYEGVRGSHGKVRGFTEVTKPSRAITRSDEKLRKLLRRRESHGSY